MALKRVPLGQRQALFRLGGWLTIAIGLTTILRTGGHLWDGLAYAALVLLSLALLARPLQPVWPQLLPWRRGIGLVGFGLAVAHSLQSVAHHWQWRWHTWRFLIMQHQVAVGLGLLALILLLPAASTSFGRAQQSLGHWWRRLHLLTLPALLLALAHATLISGRFLGGTRLLLSHRLLTLAIIALGVAILWLRTTWGTAWVRRLVKS
ncbi:MAG: hypothetical protein HC926_03010 [Synechococcaceae cyanobacterium SM2_3_60]|nr:hypothetical protein [Synechococcaceae cyanobacterium SM2_3_60]